MTTKQNHDWRDDPATDRQRAFAEERGIEIADDATKGDAHELIDAWIAANPKGDFDKEKPSPRQIMVLRFWAKDTAGWTREGISAWMDAWYAEDGDRLAAWELFKQESGDAGAQDSPDRVPVGAGNSYLARIKSERGALKGLPREEIAGNRSGSGCAVPCLILGAMVCAGGFLQINEKPSDGVRGVLIGLGIAGVSWYFIRRARRPA